MIIANLHRQLIVSVQPVIGGPLDTADIVAATALATIEGGAAALRIQGIRDVATVRALTHLPIIGLIKRTEPNTEVFITPLVSDIEALVSAGANIVAFDATLRPRPVSVANLIAAAHRLGALAMADCATLQDAEAAADQGADIIGTTLSGYIGGEIPEGPDLKFVSSAAVLGKPVFAEGRYNRPAWAAAAISNGAHAVVVGSAITRPEHITSWFKNAIDAAG